MGIGVSRFGFPVIVAHWLAPVNVVQSAEQYHQFNSCGIEMECPVTVRRGPLRQAVRRPCAGLAMNSPDKS